MSPIGDTFRQVYPSLCINEGILSAFGDRAWLYPKRIAWPEGWQVSTTINFGIARTEGQTILP